MKLAKDRYIKTIIIPLSLIVSAEGQSIFNDVSIETPSQTNTQVAGNSFSVGFDNRSYWRGVSFGNGNEGNYYSLAVGSWNKVAGVSAAFGHNNYVNKDALNYPTSHGLRYSFATGEANRVEGQRSSAMGFNNVLNADDAAAIGYRLINATDQSIVMGKYNKPKENLLFSIGDGTASRSNAFEIFNDGTAATLHGSPILTEDLGGGLSMAGSLSLGNGNVLEIHSFGDPIPLSQSAAFGSNNTVSAAHSVTVGVNNEMNSKSSVVVGELNKIGLTPGNHSQAASKNAVFGRSNEIDFGHFNFISGAGNDIRNGSNVISNSSIFGYENDVKSSYSFTAGSYNSITGEAGKAFGIRLNVGAAHATVIGKFNKTMGTETSGSTDLDQPLFVVGNGTGNPGADDERSDALIIKRNGDIIIPKPQGDISMGDFN